MNLVAFCQTAFRHVLEASLLGSVLALLIWTIQLGIGWRIGPGWRHALWLIVLARLLVPVFPNTPFSLFNAPRWLGLVKPPPKITVTIADSSSIRTPPVVAEIPFAKQTAELVELPSERLNSLQILALTWSVGSCLLLIRLLLGSYWLRARLARNSRSPGHLVLQVLASARLRLRTRANPRPIETAIVDSPGLFGLWRPKLLLPLGFGERLSESELRHVFLHELAHLKRGDLWINGLLSLTLALHWFNPLVWLCCRRVRLERELACDDLVLRPGRPDEAHAYGRTILKLLEHIQPRPILPAVVSIVEEKHAAQSRLLQIAEYGHVKPRGGKIAVAALVLVALFGLTNAQNIETRHEANPAEPGPAPFVDFKHHTLGGVQALEQDLRQQEERVAKSERQLEKLRADLNITSDWLEPARERALESKLLDARAELSQSQRLLADLKNKSRPELRRIMPSVQHDLALERFLGDLGSAEQEYADRINELGPKHPTIVSLAERMKKINEQIEDRLDGILAGLELKVIQSQAALQELAHLAETSKDHPAVEKKQLTEYFAAKRNLENQRRILDTLQHRLDQEKIDTQGVSSSPTTGAQQTNIINALPSANDGVSILIADARLLMEMHKLDEAKAKLQEVLKVDPQHRDAQYYLQQVQNFEQQPRKHENPGREALLKKLQSIVLPEWKVPANTALSDAVKRLSSEAREHDPNHVGVNLVFSSSMSRDSASPDSAEGSPKVENLVISAEIYTTNTTLLDALAGIVQFARSREKKSDDPQLVYTIEDYGVVIAKRNSNAPPPLYTRTYRIDPRLLERRLADLLHKPADGQAALIDALREYFKASGVDFSGPRSFPPGEIPLPQKAIFYDERNGVFMVRATLAELDTVEKAIQLLNLQPPQVTIDTRVIQIKPGAAYEQELLFRALASTGGAKPEVMSDLQLRAVVDALNGRAPTTPVALSAASGAYSGILQEEQFAKVIDALKKAKGVDLLSAPRITTLSGRQARVAIEPGPSVDILPIVEPDGRTIRLSTKFQMPGDSDQNKKEPAPEPEVSATGEARVGDSNTLVLGPIEREGKPAVVIFVTPTIIDPAGNRVHPARKAEQSK